MSSHTFIRKISLPYHSYVLFKSATVAPHISQSLIYGPVSHCMHNSLRKIILVCVGVCVCVCVCVCEREREREREREGEGKKIMFKYVYDRR